MCGLKTTLLFLVCCLSVIMAACAAPTQETGYPSIPDEATQTDNILAVDNESDLTDQSSPTPIWLEPDVENTPTPPPLATPLPTPPVTPIAVTDSTTLAFMATETDPFWVYYWQDNEVWRMDEQGDHITMLLDTQEEWGQWLTAIPEQLVGTECCLTGPRLAVSPDGQKLALVVVDEIQQESKDEPFAFSIYIFEIQSGESYFVSEGTWPQWSPDSQQLAYITAGDLWVTDIKNGHTSQLITADTTTGEQIAEFTWLPSGTQIAYLYNKGNHRIPTLWLTDVIETASPRQLITLEHSIHRITPTSDGEAILFLSARGSRDYSQYHLAQNLWSVSLDSSELESVTQDMVVDNYAISPNNQWLLLSGYHLYERSEETYDRDLWLIEFGRNELHRLTTNYGHVWPVGWSPDSSKPVVSDGTQLFLVTSSGDSLLQAISPTDIQNFIVGEAK
jgi:hypothetical protein